MIRNIRNTSFKALGTGMVVFASVELTTKLPSEGRSSQLYHSLSDEVVTPLMRRLLNPEGVYVRC